MYRKIFLFWFFCASVEGSSSGVMTIFRKPEQSKIFCPRSLRLAKTLTNLAHLYRGVGQHDKSLHAFSRVYELRRERLGEDHPLTLVSLSGKAAAMTHQHTLRDENGDFFSNLKIDICCCRSSKR